MWFALYSVTHKESDYRDDCMEFTWFVVLYSRIPANIKLFLSKSLDMSLDYYIRLLY